jgi:hypothetical protein
VCLENNCVTPEREYPRRHEWIEHVRQNHWKAYKCTTCQSSFSSFADCKSHLETVHPSQRSEAELDALVKLSEQSLDIGQGVPCPLCHEILNSAQQYQRHVGRHQEQLSLFALPSFEPESEAEEETDDDQDSDGSILDDRPPDNAFPPPNEKFKCNFAGCGKEFSREADRERHYLMVHTDPDQGKSKNFCDYKKCSRNTQPFYRQDHFRDHLRLYHKEDLLRRGNHGDAEWWASRSPICMINGWWRCNRCLIRVNITEHGFVCSGCGRACEKVRQERRMGTSSTEEGDQKKRSQ